MSTSEGNNWRSQAFRQAMVGKIEDAVIACRVPVIKTPMEMESQIFSKAKSRDEYMSFVARLIIYINETGSKVTRPGMTDHQNPTQEKAMTGKRQATYELNHDNYDDELPEEEAGQWKPADQSVLKDRPKLKARRSLANSSDSSDKPSLFGSFSFNLSGSGAGGLNTTPTTASASPFGGLNFGTRSSEKTNGTSKVAKVLPVPSIGSRETPTGSPATVLKVLPKHENTKSSTNKDVRLKEIAAAKLRLLQEKERIEKELKNLELEESQLREQSATLNKSVSTVGGSNNIANTEEPELPPEEPWN